MFLGGMKIYLGRFGLGKNTRLKGKEFYIFFHIKSIPIHNRDILADLVPLKPFVSKRDARCEH